MKKIICFLSFLLLLPFRAECMALEQNLNVEIGIFNAAETTMFYNLDDNSYSFSSKVETAGLFSKLYYFNALYNTKGKIKDNKFITQNYDYVSKSSSHTRTKKLVFDDLGTLIKRVSSKDTKEKTVAIDVGGINFDFNDLQSVFAYLAKQLKDNKFCDMQKEVFDGKKTYKVTVKDEGFIDFYDEDVSMQGKALKCSMFIERTDNQDDDLLFSTTANRPINFWIMYQKEMPYIAKIEIDSTPLGKLKAYTTNINIKD